MFILITFLALHGCVNGNDYEVKKHFRLQNSVEGLGIDLKILKHLAKAFPNHAIEIQVQGTDDEVPKMKKFTAVKNPKFRGDRQFHHKWPYRIIGRSGENPNLDNASLANAGASKPLLPTSHTTTTTTTMTTELETMPTLPTTGMRELFPNQPGDLKRPLYMEDLIQALEDFEKKLFTNRSSLVVHSYNGKNHKKKNDMDNEGSSSTSEDANRPVVKKDLWDLEKNLSPQIKNCNAADKKSTFGSYEQPALPYIDNKNMGVKNFHDVLRLMKQGVKVQLDVTTPRHRNRNVKWVPIKIPNDAYH